MGRDWLHKAGGGGGGGGVDGGGGGRLVRPPPVDKPVNGKKEKDRNSSFSGCMSAFFDLFDVQGRQFGFHRPSFVSESVVTSHRNSKFDVDQGIEQPFAGIEQPRSSLESPEMAVAGAPSSSEVEEQMNLNIPVGRIQIKTKRSRFTDELSSNYSISPGTKTPNLVARLMGLDLLPEYSSPRPSSSSAPANSHHRSHSLPATPRLSTASRRSTDQDYHHRLSLQIDQKNRKICQKMSRPRSEILVDPRDSDRKRQHAKVITNQVREKISRRLGTDITNTVSLTNPHFSQNENALAVQSASLSKINNNATRLSRSPKLKLLDIKENFNKPFLNSHRSSINVAKSKPKAQTLAVVTDEKMKRIARDFSFPTKRHYNTTTRETYDLRLKNKHQQEDQYLNVKNRRKVVSFRKDMTSSSSTARSWKVQASFASNMNSSNKPVDTHNLNSITTTTATNRGSFSDQLCKMVKSFPATSCNVLKHVDGLIKKDMTGRSTQRLLATAVEEIVKEVEQQVVEGLVEEITTETVALHRRHGVKG